MKTMTPKNFHCGKKNIVAGPIAVTALEESKVLQEVEAEFCKLLKKDNPTKKDYINLFHRAVSAKNNTPYHEWKRLEDIAESTNSLLKLAKGGKK